MQILPNKIYRLKNERIAVLIQVGAKFELHASDNKIIPVSSDMGKYAPVYELADAKPYFLSDAQILNHLTSRNKRHLHDQLATWDGTTLVLPTETDLKATLAYRKSASQRYPTFKVADYIKDAADTGFQFNAENKT